MVKAKAKVTKKKSQNKVTNSPKIKSKKSKIIKTKEYEFFDHTADAKFKAHGKNFQSALANAAKATVQVITDIKKIKPKQKKQITLQAKTKESLVYDFIEEIIFLIDTEGFLMKEVSKIKIENKNSIYVLSAELKGDNAKNYDVHTCVKAVTYNDMEIAETKKNCTIQIVLDI